MLVVNPKHIKLDEWQEAFIACEGNKILCCGRQIGKSECCSIDAVEYAITHPRSKPIVMIAPTERQAYGLFSKTLQYITDCYPNYIMKKKDKPTKTKIRLKINKSIVDIYCLPVGATGLGIRFLTIGRLYVDEASQLPELVWDAVLPALLTTGGDIVVLSTPFGAQGTFYNIWINKDGAWDDFTRFSKTSEIVIRDRPLSDTWTEKQREKALLYIDSAKKRLSKRTYAQEYLGEFVDDLYRWFSDELINQSCVLKRNEPFPRSANYFLGVDIARMGEDNSSFAIMLRTTDMMYLTDLQVTSKTLTTDTEKKIIDLDNHYNFRKIYLDAGSGTLGVSVMDHLIRMDKLKTKVVAINNAQRLVDYRLGTKVRLAKEDLYENLKSLMEQGRIKLLDDEELKYELSMIQYEYVSKQGKTTFLRIFAKESPDRVESVIRAAWGVKEKINKLDILYF